MHHLVIWSFQDLWEVESMQKNSILKRVFEHKFRNESIQGISMHLIICNKKYADYMEVITLFWCLVQVITHWYDIIWIINLWDIIKKMSEWWLYDSNFDNAQCFKGVRKLKMQNIFFTDNLLIWIFSFCVSKKYEYLGFHELTLMWIAFQYPGIIVFSH